MLESFIVEVRRWVSARRDLDIDESPILTMLGRVGGRVLLGAVRLPMWVIRLGFDRSGTWAGVREWVLDEAPLAPGRTRASLRAVAAVEQAGSVERAAEQARAEARAEVERIQALASGQVDETMQQAEELVSGARAEAAEQVRAAEQHAAQQIEQVRQSTEAKLQQADQTSEQLADELDRLRAEYDRVIGAASSKTRLIAAYERLGSAGDPRWMDRDRAGEVARELYQAAGLSSEGTARAYLYEYISGTKQGVSA
jgi:cell division septum initiation protein DivIVA